MCISDVVMCAPFLAISTTLTPVHMCVHVRIQGLESLDTSYNTHLARYPLRAPHNLIRVTALSHKMNYHMHNSIRTSIQARGALVCPGA